MADKLAEAIQVTYRLYPMRPDRPVSTMLCLLCLWHDVERTYVVRWSHGAWATAATFRLALRTSSPAIG